MTKLPSARRSQGTYKIHRMHLTIKTAKALPGLGEPEKRTLISGEQEEMLNVRRKHKYTVIIWIIIFWDQGNLFQRNKGTCISHEGLITDIITTPAIKPFPLELHVSVVVLILSNG